MECDKCDKKTAIVRKCLAKKYTMVTGGCYNTKQTLCDECVKDYICQSCGKYGCDYVLNYVGPYALYDKKFC